MIALLVISPFRSKETLIFFLKMILFAEMQQILHWKLFRISSYVTWTDGSCMALPCQAAILGRAEEPPGASPWTSRKIPWANRHAWLWDQVKNCALARLPVFMTQKQVPQDPERGTNSPRETSSKFGWIIKINKSLLWEKTVSQGMLYQKSDLVYGKSCSVIGSWALNACILIVPWALEHKGTKQIKMPDFTELVV